MTALHQLRWPLRPLLAAAGNPSAATLAQRVGVASRTIWRWRRHGLTDAQADRAAVALGYHPAMIWAHWLNPDQLTQNAPPDTDDRPGPQQPTRRAAR